MIISTISETGNPDKPTLSYRVDDSLVNRDGRAINLVWNRTAYKPRYLIYQMNAQGNWVKIHELESNEEKIVMSLSETTLTEEELEKINLESRENFNHFRVDVENTAGLINIEKNRVTIPSE